MKPKVVLHFNSTINHNNQIYCGLELLRKQGLIDLEYKYAFKSLYVSFTLMEVNGMRILFDLQDNSKINPNHYDDCDFMVKRMLLATDVEKFPKLVPFGLNYPVFSSNKFMLQVFLKNRKLLPFSLRYHRTLSRLFNINESLYNCDYRKFGKIATKKKAVIFATRLWNPERGNEDWKKDERYHMNEERIGLVRQMKQKFGNHFYGGIQAEPLSREKCPDILLSKKLTDKKYYLKTLRRSSIGICNKGLEDSIGWKFAEYLSDSLAVVTNPIDRYVNHGNLKNGEHFLEYRTYDECLLQVERLLEDDSLRQRISDNNKAYYRDYLHPASKFREIFRSIGVELPQSKIESI